MSKISEICSILKENERPEPSNIRPAYSPETVIEPETYENIEGDELYSILNNCKSNKKFISQDNNFSIGLFKDCY